MVKPSLLLARVTHNRVTPVSHRFVYTLPFLVFSLADWSRLPSFCRFLRLEKFGIWSLKKSEYLLSQNESLLEKARFWLARKGFTEIPEQVVLVTLPRFFFFGFKPVNFYLCGKAADPVRQLIVEINNTFGEKHLYLFQKGPESGEAGEAVFTTGKEFHVSPFNKVEGQYRIAVKWKNADLSVHFTNVQADKAFFHAGIEGSLVPLTTRSALQALLRYPLSGLLTTGRIGYQAALLYFRKKLPVHTKPDPTSQWTIFRGKPVLLQRWLAGNYLDKFQPKIHKARML